MATESQIDKEFGQQLKQLRDFAAQSADPCITAQMIALSDAKVSALFLSKLKEGNSYNGAFCGRVEIAEQRSVIFDFDCPSGRLCLVKPSFLVVVQIVEKQVLQIIDPYIPSERSGLLPFTLSIPSNAPNVMTPEGR